ncbi:hypothetical protein, partial [Comamonas sp.]|uniref:hypothetical protein n=1 Tax=Comamonas sp. TaxID=34028 RepID=UPI003A92C049
MLSLFTSQDHEINFSRFLLRSHESLKNSNIYIPKYMDLQQFRHGHIAYSSSPSIGGPDLLYSGLAAMISARFFRPQGALA